MQIISFSRLVKALAEGNKTISEDDDKQLLPRAELLDMIDQKTKTEPYQYLEAIIHQILTFSAQSIHLLPSSLISTRKSSDESLT